MKMVMLDATAGNRMMWPNKNLPLVVFIDKEFRLARPPDIFADNRFCPFRDDVFETVIFDPPHLLRKPPPWWNQPHMPRTRESGEQYSLSTKSWYGSFNGKLEMLISINKAQKEFHRISKRLCMKWSVICEVSLWNIIPLIDCWKEIHRIRRKSKYGKKGHWWITFLKSY